MDQSNPSSSVNITYDNSFVSERGAKSSTIKRLQFSAISDASFISEPTELDMTLGLPLSDDESVSSQRSSVDMFEETVTEATPGEDPVDIIPLTLPPSTTEVMASLPSLGIPETINPTPYFSNYQDVKKKKEVGGHILSLVSRNIVDLEEFRSGIAECSISDQQKALLEFFLDDKSAKTLAKVAASLVSDKTVYITPVMRPPSVREVVLWDKARAVLKAEKIPSVPASAPPTPSQDSDSSLNLSQCSSSDVTPKSSQESPILKRTSRPKRLGIRRKSRRLSVEPSLSAIKEDSDESLNPTVSSFSWKQNPRVKFSHTY